MVQTTPEREAMHQSAHVVDNCSLGFKYWHRNHRIRGDRSLVEGKHNETNSSKYHRGKRLYWVPGIHYATPCYGNEKGCGASNKENGASVVNSQKFRLQRGRGESNIEEENDKYCKMPVQTDNYGDRFTSDLVRDSSTIRLFYLSPDPSLCDHLDEKSVDVEQFMAIYPQKITTETLADRILTAGDPPPDILIRTSGAYRLSDFLLW